MCLALLPAHQEEHIHVGVLCQRKRDEKSEEVTHDLNHDIAVTESQTD